MADLIAFGLSPADADHLRSGAPHRGCTVCSRIASEALAIAVSWALSSAAHEHREAGEPLTVTAGPKLPPRPWTSPALIQPWPDSAAYYDPVVDATGRPVFSGNWSVTAEALRYVVLLVNEQHRREVATGPDQGQLAPSNVGGDDA